MEEFILKYSKWFPYCERDNLIESMRDDLKTMGETSEQPALNIAGVGVSFLNYYAAAERSLMELTGDERMNLFSGYCKACGCDDPDCQCWNDE